MNLNEIIEENIDERLNKEIDEIEESLYALTNQIISNKIGANKAREELAIISNWYYDLFNGSICNLCYDYYCEILSRIKPIYLGCERLISEKWGNLYAVVSNISTEIRDSSINIICESADTFALTLRENDLVIYREVMDLDIYTAQGLYEHVLITALNFL